MSVVFSRGLSKSDRELAGAAALAELLCGALGDLGLGPANLNCRLATPIEIRRINREFAQSDHVTDVLAFPVAPDEGSGFQLPPSEEGFLGDIVISVRTAATQAELAGDDPQAELQLLAVHGLLHLLGHHHGEQGPADRMTRATALLLGQHAARRGLPEPRVPQLQPRA
ncbi:MAG TPA: rRNA maturation RNase YbeY [Candidatus Acidoferrales bacterium]|nr:rRNA maturation RNase YbeY [Candidatus Acidoferrales bacterium]